MTPAGGMSFIAPKTYDELHRDYGKHIQKLLTRCNKVQQNFEDLHSWVWVKLIDANVLARFDDFVGRQTPRTVTPLEACVVLGVSWSQWRTAMEEWHLRRQAVVMPVPVNLDEYKVSGEPWVASKTALFAYPDIFELTYTGPYTYRRNGHEYPGMSFERVGQAIDAEGNVVEDTRPEGFYKPLAGLATRTLFVNYLNKAVMNHYANFCRTLDRRHKERPIVIRPNDRGDAPIWEETLRDDTGLSAETLLDLHKQQNRLSGVLRSCLPGSSHQSGIHEIAIFGALRDGATLPQALRSSALPQHVRKAVLRALGQLPSDEPATALAR